MCIPACCTPADCVTVKWGWDTSDGPAGLSLDLRHSAGVGPRETAPRAPGGTDESLDTTPGAPVRWPPHAPPLCTVDGWARVWHLITNAASRGRPGGSGRV